MGWSPQAQSRLLHTIDSSHAERTCASVVCQLESCVYLPATLVCPSSRALCAHRNHATTPGTSDATCLSTCVRHRSSKDFGLGGFLIPKDMIISVAIATILQNVSGWDGRCMVYEKDLTRWQMVSATALAQPFIRAPCCFLHAILLSRRPGRSSGYTATS